MIWMERARKVMRFKKNDTENELQCDSYALLKKGMNGNQMTT